MTTPVSGQAQLFMQLQQMQDEMSRLRGMLEEQQNQIQQMKQENQERFQDIDSRLSSGAGAGAAGAAVQQNSPAAGASAGAATGAGVAAAQQQQPAASSEPGDPAKEKLYYDAAFDLIKAKDFDKASQAFGAFLRKYPNSQYAGNAQYWLGEVNLAKGDLQGAARLSPASARPTRAAPRCRTRCTSSPMSSAAWVTMTRLAASCSRWSRSIRALPLPNCPSVI